MPDFFGVAAAILPEIHDNGIFIKKTEQILMIL